MTNQAKTEIKVTMTNNSDAAKLLRGRLGDALGGIWADARHNGGKVVILLVDTDDVSRVEEALDRASCVAVYETR